MTDQCLLTIVIFLKDRFEFTPRICAYLTSIDYPFKVYFADGSIGDEHELFFQNLGNQSFDYTYKRYPKDITVEDYYKKAYGAICDVGTPYTMLVDNDDFPIIEGQIKAVEFLEQSSDYVGCNGTVSGFRVYPLHSASYGKKVQFFSKYCHMMDEKSDLSSCDPIERIISYMDNFYSIFYSVFRTRALMKTYKYILDCNYSDLGIMELAFSCLMLAEGKVANIDEITYIRQMGSSQAASQQKDWFHRLFYTNWYSDCQRFFDDFSVILAQKSQSSQKVIHERLYSVFVNKMRNRYLPNQFYALKNWQIFFSTDFIKRKIFYDFGWLIPSFLSAASLRNISPSTLSIIRNIILEARL